MRNFAITLLVAGALILLLRAGMQPINAEVNPAGSELPPAARVDWQLAGSFGRPASLLDPAEENPWLKRYDEGGFLEISGVSAGEDRVMVCDTGISRVQVFDRNGEFIEDIGVGMPIREIRPSDVEYYLEDSMVTREIPRFNDIYGPLFRDKYRGIFQASDLAIVEDGWYMADMLRTGDRTGDARKPSLLWFGNDGSVGRFNIDSMIWPMYVAAEGTQVTVSEPEGNAFYWGERDGDNPRQWKIGFPTGTTQYANILRVRESFFGHRRYIAMMGDAQNVSAAAGGYSLVGGMDFAFEKLVVCDAGNARVQVYDATGRDQSRRDSLVKVIPGRDDEGRLRFSVPLDIAIDDNDGQLYILDSSRKEVAILDSHFSRIGSFGLGELHSPRAIAISPDGNDVYVTDDADQCVYHYACADRR